MSRHILNTGAFTTWIPWLERIVLVSGLIYFANKAYLNQPKLTSSLLYATQDGTLNITCDPNSDAAVVALKQATRDLARTMFNWDKGKVAAYKLQYEALKPFLLPSSEAEEFVYNQVVANIGSEQTKGIVETSDSRFEIDFDDKGWKSQKSSNDRMWGVSATITQKITKDDSTPNIIKWDLYMELVKGGENALFSISIIDFSKQ